MRNNGVQDDNFVTAAGQHTLNKTKNRSNRLLPSDHTRFRLVPIPGVPASEYINATHINGYKARGAYIATQGQVSAPLSIRTPI